MYKASSLTQRFTTKLSILFILCLEVVENFRSWRCSWTYFHSWSSLICLLSSTLKQFAWQRQQLRSKMTTKRWVYTSTISSLASFSSWSAFLSCCLSLIQSTILTGISTWILRKATLLEMENNRLVLVNIEMTLILSFNLMQSSLKACTQRQTFTKPIIPWQITRQ